MVCTNERYRISSTYGVFKEPKTAIVGAFRPMKLHTWTLLGL